MAATRIVYDDDEPKVGVNELIKTPRSSSSTRREYLRMRAEKELLEKAENLLPPVSEEPSELQDNENPCSIPDADIVIKTQESEPEITSFPFVDVVDGAPNKKSTKHVEANAHPGHRHGAKLCMLSAMIHMKSLANRKPKSISELKKKPLTTKQESSLKLKVEESDSDSEPEEELAYLKKCRYLRGTNEDKELTIDEIFG